MIVPNDPEPTFILVNPKQMTADSRFKYHPFERRTYGDYLGVRGVLAAFASVYGELFTPEILQASVAPLDLADADANFYLIGSHKANPFTNPLLDRLQEGLTPSWRFGRCPGPEDVADFEVLLTGTLNGAEFATVCHRAQPKPGEITEDYGLIVRGPHPSHPHRMVTIMAGPHSLGTSAACLAATRSEHARRIGELLVGQADLASRDRAIWVLVKGKIGEDLQVRSEDVEVVAAGVYEAVN